MTSYAFRTEPMAHQVKGLRHIIRQQGRSILACDPGTGKTKVVIDYMAMLALSRGTCRAFVIAPLSALDTWPDQVDEHLPEGVTARVTILQGPNILTKAKQLKELDMSPEEGPTVHLVIVNLDALSSNRRVKGTTTVTTRHKMMSAIRSHEWDLGVVDESHRIKGHSSNVSRAMYSLAPSFPRRLALTGTVAPNGPLDFFAQMRWVEADVFGANWTSFKDRYAVLGGPTGQTIISYRNIDHMSRKIRDWMFVAKKADCLDLPEVTDARIRVDLSKKERDLYDEASKLAVASIDKNTQVIIPSALSKFLRLRQLASGFIGDSDTGEVHDVGTTKIDAAVEKIRDLVANGEKIVVFAHFTRDVRRMQAGAEKAVGKQVPVWMIDGSVDPDERRRIRKEFQSCEGGAVVVAQMRTVGLAVNEFVVAQHAIFLSLSERHDDYTQARDRLDRHGQTKPVTIWHVIARDTIDVAMLDTYRQKGTLEAAVLAEARRIQLQESH